MALYAMKKPSRNIALNVESVRLSLHQFIFTINYEETGETEKIKGKMCHLLDGFRLKRNAKRRLINLKKRNDTSYLCFSLYKQLQIRTV